MSTPNFDSIISAIADMDLSELRAIEASVKTALKIRGHNNLSSDSPFTANLDTAGEGPSLNDWAQDILENEAEYSLTLADQAFLAALVLSDVYQQDTFSSRDINNVIKESGRPAVANITTALTGLKDRSFLVGSDNKALSLSTEGRKKARALIGMLRRENAA